MDDEQRTGGIGFTYITFDIAIARCFAERMQIMFVGNLVERGEADRGPRKPRHGPAAARLRAEGGSDPGVVRIVCEILPHPGRLPIVVTGNVKASAGARGAGDARCRCPRAYRLCSNRD